jgi:hypothetical protein
MISDIDPDIPYLISRRVMLLSAISCISTSTSTTPYNAPDVSTHADIRRNTDGCCVSGFRRPNSRADHTAWKSGHSRTSCTLSNCSQTPTSLSRGRYR